MAQPEKPHAVVVPFPAQGHIKPMLNLAKVLHATLGFHITFVNTLYNHRRLLRSGAALHDLSSFRFTAISDGLPFSDDGNSATQHIPTLFQSLLDNFVDAFKQLVVGINNEADLGHVPHVTHIVGDFAMPMVVDAGAQMGLPVVLFWNASAPGLLGYALYQSIIDRGIVPFKDSSFMTDGSLDMLIDWVPDAVKGICLRDIPSFIRITDLNDIMFKYMYLCDKVTCQSGCPVIFNTFDALDHDVLEAISIITVGPIYCLGPIHLLVDRVGLDDETNSLSANLWKEDPTCLQWLDTQKLDSVIYIGFGCTTTMSKENLIEFAWGLANSNHHFLWIIRPDLVSGDSAILPSEFETATRGRGMLASWCNQERVLSHPAIGAFLTHTGWNSTIESISSGVPMLCWPFFAEQQMNCWFCHNKWGIGIEIDNDVKRDAVEKQVREMMEGEKGEELRTKAKEWKRLAEEAVTAPNGSSYMDLQRLAKEVFLASN